MSRKSGFTIIELIVVIVILFSASLLFYHQKSRIEATARDNTRKANINTIYHNLEEIFYKKHNYYPKKVSASTLPAVPSDTFKDPSGIEINQLRSSNLGLNTEHSSYHYDPTGCNYDKCSGYTLRADLEQEADYKKEAKHKGITTNSDQDKNNSKSEKDADSKSKD